VLGRPVIRKVRPTKGTADTGVSQKKGQVTSPSLLIKLGELKGGNSWGRYVKEENMRTEKNSPGAINQRLLQKKWRKGDQVWGRRGNGWEKKKEMEKGKIPAWSKGRAHQPAQLRYPKESDR